MTTPNQTSPIGDSTALVAEHHGPWCGHAACPCGVAGPVCPEYVGNDETKGFCPRCGWSEAVHQWAANWPHDEPFDIQGGACGVCGYEYRSGEG